MEVRWAPRTVKDLDHIFKRIERENPKAARSVIQTIYNGCVVEIFRIWHGAQDWK